MAIREGTVAGEDEALLVRRDAGVDIKGVQALY